MPWIHPKGWEDGIMPLSELPDDIQERIEWQIAQPRPPSRWIEVTAARLESRGWWEWHWARGRRLFYVPGPGRRRIPQAVRAAVVERDGYVCGICRLDVDPPDVHIDHIHPVALGGTNELDNLQVSHSRCNIRKGARVNGSQVREDSRLDMV